MKVIAGQQRISYIGPTQTGSGCLVTGANIISGPQGSTIETQAVVTATAMSNL